MQVTEAVDQATWKAEATELAEVATAKVVEATAKADEAMQKAEEATLKAEEAERKAEEKVVEATAKVLVVEKAAALQAQVANVHRKQTDRSTHSLCSLFQVRNRRIRADRSVGCWLGRRCHYPARHLHKRCLWPGELRCDPSPSRCHHSRESEAACSCVHHHVLRWAKALSQDQSLMQRSKFRLSSTEQLTAWCTRECQTRRRLVLGSAILLIVGPGLRIFGSPRTGMMCNGPYRARTSFQSRRSKFHWARACSPQVLE